MILFLLIAALAMTGCSNGAPTGAVSETSKVAPAQLGGSGGPLVSVGRVEAAAGAVVAIDVSLSGAKGLVVATATDIRYDASKVRVVAGAQGQPDCQLAPAVAEPQVKKQIFAKERWADGDAILRVGLLGVDNANPLPDGKLFTCRFQLAEGVAGGEVTLRVSTQGSDAKALPVEVGGTDGAISVK